MSAIPFVSIKYNVVCKNIYEKDIDKINPMTIGEVCNILNYSQSHSDRLKKIFSSCKFMNGKTAVGMVYGGSTNNWRLFINPKVYYGGNNHREVEVLGGF